MRFKDINAPESGWILSLFNRVWRRLGQDRKVRLPRERTPENGINRQASFSPLASYLSPDSLGRSVYLLLRTHRTIRRITEVIEVRETSLLRSITYEFHSRYPGPALVALLKPSKGSLVDNLQVTSDGDVQLYTLTRQETQTAMVAVLERYAELVLLENQVNIGIVEVRDAIDRVKALPRLDADEGKRVLRELETLRKQPRRSISHPLNDDPFFSAYGILARDDQLLDLASLLQEFRIVFSPFAVPEENTKITVNYESNRIGISNPGLRARIRELFGHTHFDLRFEIPLALRAPSYHFRFRAPTGQYVRNQLGLQPRYLVHGGSGRLHDWELLPIDVDELNRRRPVDHAPAFLEGQGLNVTDYAHLYMGSLRARSSDRTPRRVYAKVIVNEIPAGETGRMLVRALAALAVMLAVWFLAGRIIASSGGAAYAITLLLALPSVYSFGLLASSNRREPLMSPMFAGIGTTLSGLLSMASSVVFLWWATAYSGPHPKRGAPGLVFLSIIIVQGLVAGFGFWRLSANIYRSNEARRLTNRSAVLPGGV